MSFIRSSASSERSEMNHNSLRPNSVPRVPAGNLSLMSPSDIVGPSPVTSNGTETTEIEDEEVEEAHESEDITSPDQPQVGTIQSFYNPVELI